MARLLRTSLAAVATSILLAAPLYAQVQGAPPAPPAQALPPLPPSGSAPAYPPAPPGYAPAPGAPGYAPAPPAPGTPGATPPGYPPAQGAPPGYPQAPPGWAPGAVAPGWAPGTVPPGYAPYPSNGQAYDPSGAVQWRFVPGPTELRYETGQAVPPGYHVETRARRGLVIAGAVVLGVPYFFSVSIGASSSNTADRWLYVPVVGPFIDLASRGDRCTRSSSGNPNSVSFTNDNCSDDSGNRFLITFDGLMQAAGMTMLVLGLALPQHLLVRDFAPYTGHAPAPTFAWAMGPRSFGRTGYGLGVDGTF